MASRHRPVTILEPPDWLVDPRLADWVEPDDLVNDTGPYGRGWYAAWRRWSEAKERWRRATGQRVPRIHTHSTPPTDKGIPRPTDWEQLLPTPKEQ